MADTIQVLYRFRAAFEDFSSCLGRLDEGALRQRIVAEWSPADLAAHFAGYHLQRAAELSRLAEGIEPRDPDTVQLSDDEENARFVAEAEGLTRQQVTEGLSEAFETCYAAFEAFSGEGHESARTAADWIEEEIVHYRAHTHELRSALSVRTTSTP